MPSQTVTTTPTALENIDPDIAYAFQVRGAPIHIIAAESAPTHANDAFTTGSGELSIGRFRRNADQQIYVWTDKSTSRIVYNEAP